jgi:hypothetical protein
MKEGTKEKGGRSSLPCFGLEQGREQSRCLVRVQAGIGLKVPETMREGGDQFLNRRKKGRQSEKRQGSNNDRSTRLTSVTPSVDVAIPGDGKVVPRAGGDADHGLGGVLFGRARVGGKLGSGVIGCWGGREVDLKTTEKRNEGR